MIVRRATAADVPLLAPLAQALENTWLMQQYDRDKDVLLATFAAALRRDDTLCVAVDDGRATEGPESAAGTGPLRQGAIVGIVWWAGHAAFVTGAYLRLLAVHPEYVGRKVGRQLLAAFEAQSAQPSGGWFLLVHADNARAIQFYQVNGYRIVGQLPDFAKKGCLETIMHKAPARAHTPR